MKNDIGYEEYCHEENYVSPLEEFLSRMCASVLPQGENTYRGIKLDDDSLKEKKKTPAEYIAYGFAFFSVFSNHKEISEKNELLAQIKELSLDLYEDVTIWYLHIHLVCERLFAISNCCTTRIAGGLMFHSGSFLC